MDFFFFLNWLCCYSKYSKYHSNFQSLKFFKKSASESLNGKLLNYDFTRYARYTKDIENLNISFSVNNSMLHVTYSI